MKFYCTALIFLTLFSCQNTTTLKYPHSKKGDTIDRYFGVEVSDPYRWLEDDMSDQTKDWIENQNKVTFGYLDKIPFRNDIKKRLTSIWNYEKLGTPLKEGDYTYFYKNSGIQNHYVLFRNKENSTPEVFLDPNSFSEDGTISMSGVSFSNDGSHIAYSISEGGSDWRKVIIRDAVQNKIIGDTLKDIKFSRLSWKNNEGFYYSSYDKPQGSELSGKTDQHKLYYHKLGTPQSEDQIVFGGIPEQKHRYVRGYVTQDARYLLVSASKSTSGNKLYIKDLTKKKASLVPVVSHYQADSYVIENEGSQLFIVTNLNAPNKKIVTVDANNPSPEHWEDVIPESEHVLVPSKGSGYFFAEYMIDALSKVYQYRYDGSLIREIKLPGIGSASGFSGKKDQKELYFNFTNYHTPSSSYLYDPKSGKYSLYWTPEILFKSSDYVSNQVFYTSKDGTKIPMIITHKKDVTLDGNNPTILYGYGGFNISLTPSFSITNAIWMDLGGVYAVPNLRGGGEYGKEWHKAGTLMQKQNVFDDFIGAAEYLIAQNYTNSNRLAIRGGSNGGLLVGAVMTQRPTLMRVALPAVGVMDMLRYHTFTSGAGWAYDFGTSEQSKDMFEYLRNYSPLHNLVEGTSYPATLVTTANKDDRVVPSHSFKFAATLQEKHIGENPVLIRIETNAGHGAGTPVNKTIDQYADIFGFTLHNMGVNPFVKTTKF